MPNSIDLRKTRIDLSKASKKEKEAFQKYAFSKGFGWNDPERVKITKNLDKDYYFCSEDGFLIVGEQHEFNMSRCKDITDAFFEEYARTQDPRLINVLSKELCVKIWSAWNEIKKGQKLIADANMQLGDHNEDETLYNAFGDRKGMELGVPSGSNSHSILGVSYDLAETIILQHIEDSKLRLLELNKEVKKTWEGYENENA